MKTKYCYIFKYISINCVYVNIGTNNTKANKTNETILTIIQCIFLIIIKPSFNIDIIPYFKENNIIVYAYFIKIIITYCEKSY